VYVVDLGDEGVEGSRGMLSLLLVQIYKYNYVVQIMPLHVQVIPFMGCFQVILFSVRKHVIQLHMLFISHSIFHSPSDHSTDFAAHHPHS